MRKLTFVMPSSHQWIFITDTVDAVYRPEEWFQEALLDRLAEVVGALPVSEVSIISPSIRQRPFTLTPDPPNTERCPSLRITAGHACWTGHAHASATVAGAPADRQRAGSRAVLLNREYIIVRSGVPLRRRCRLACRRARPARGPL